MPRDKKHFVLNEVSTGHAFKRRGAGQTSRPTDVANRAAHAQAILQALDHLPDLVDRPGLYLDVQGRPGEVMVPERFDVSDLKLLRFEPGAGGGAGHAIVFATESGLQKLRDKIDAFQGELPTKKDGSVGRPKNADLAQSINGAVDAIVEAGLQRLWRSPIEQFPDDGPIVQWEVWLEPDEVASFREHAVDYGVAVGTDQIEFPEDTIVVASATRAALAVAVRRLGGVRALAVPTVTAEHFDAMEPEEQADWVDELAQRTSFAPPGQATYITLLDRGVSRAHPLIAPALDVADRHTADPGWDVEDHHGHGTRLAGLSLYGDLAVAVQSTAPIAVTARLESAKIIPDTAAGNPHHLLGTVTRWGVDAVEVANDRRRAFVLANTTDQDTPHSGAPSLQNRLRIFPELPEFRNSGILSGGGVGAISGARADQVLVLLRSVRR